MKKTIIDEIENMMKKVKKKKRKYIFKKHEKNVNQIDKVFTLFKVNMFKKMNYKNVKYYIRRKGHTMYRYKFRKDYEKKPFVFGSGKLETKEFHNEIKNYIMEMICLKRQQVRHKTRINVIENEVISEFRKQKLLQKTNIINNKFFITERSKSRKEQEKVKSRTQKINKLQKIFNRYNDRREYSLRFHYDPTNPLIANRARLRNVVKNINNVVKKMKSSQSSLLQELKKERR